MNPLAKLTFQRKSDIVNSKLELCMYTCWDGRLMKPRVTDLKISKMRSSLPLEMYNSTKTIFQMN